jgi:hypothetical protein
VAPAAISYLVAFLYLSYHPDDRWPVMVLANLTLSLNLFLAWFGFGRRPSTDA